MSNLSLTRLVTIHPLLVHVTLGVLPVVVVAYGIAALRRSERWSFAGDVALWIGAAVAPAAVGFGLVSNALLDWPGGISTWRWLHLGFGIGSTALLLALAGARLRALRRGALADFLTLGNASAVALLFAFTGWVGGEVLVYHSGMAVAAAAQGALAPAISLPQGTPASFLDCMGRLRGAWAEAATQFDAMLVDHPTGDGYARISVAARDLTRLAGWLSTQGPAAFARAQAGGAAPDASGTIAQMAEVLEERARTLEEAARQRNWSLLGQSLDGVTRTCAGCHETLRWKR